MKYLPDVVVVGNVGVVVAAVVPSVVVTGNKTKNTQLTGC